MRLVSFLVGDEIRAGLVNGDWVIDLHQASGGRLPKVMRRLIELGDEGIALMRELSALYRGICSLGAIPRGSPA